MSIKMNIYLNEKTNKWELLIDDPSTILDIGTYKEIMERKGNNFPFCPEHNESVTERKDDFPDPTDISTSNKFPSFLTHLPSVVFSGCCREIMTAQMESIESILDEYRKNNPPRVIGL